MEHSKVIISVIGYENHPDICGVLDYLENHGVIPPYYEEFAFCAPQGEYEDYSDRFSYAIQSGRKVVVPGADGGITTYAHYRPKNGLEDWIFVLARCETKEDEQKVADYYKQEVLQSEVVPEDRIHIVLSEQDDPEFPEDEIGRHMFSGGEMDGLAGKLLNRIFGENNFSITGCNYSFTDSDSAEYEINFSYLGKTFALVFYYESGDFHAQLTLTRNEWHLAGTEYRVESFGNLKDYILENFFGAAEMKQYVKTDVRFTSPRPVIDAGKLVFSGEEDGHPVCIIIDPVSKDVSITFWEEPEEAPEELPESLEAKVDFIYKQMNWLKEQYAVHDEAIKRLQAK